jgi:hypothetical protein
MLFIISTSKVTGKQSKTPSTDAVEAKEIAKALYSKPEIKSAGVVHQTGVPIFYRTKDKTRRTSWVG